MDHGTDYPMPRQAIRFLFAVPIEYVGGNSAVLGLCLAIVVSGLLKRESIGRRSPLSFDFSPENLVFMTWAAMPPIFMYCYSYLSQPIFGPPRYHLFIAPAYLILLAHGLTRLPSVIRWPLLAGGAALSVSLGAHYQQVQKTDWRGLNSWLEDPKNESTAGKLTRGTATIVVHPSDSRFPREQLEAARYYLSPRFRVIAPDDRTLAESADQPGLIYDVYCLARPEPPANSKADEQAFYGMRVKRR
jgi:hypothetical protein